MTQKIVNVSEIDGLKIRGSASCKNQEGVMETDEWISKDDLRALLDKSLSVSGEVFGYVSDTTYSVTDSGTVRKTPNQVFKNAVYTTPQPDRVAELEAKLKVASEALENIVKHFDLMGKSITEYSITYQIATEALAKIKD